MKKSNIFMFAYVIFLFVVAGMKIFTDIHVFEQILLATTISSYFFTLGDFCSYLLDCYKELDLMNNEMLSIKSDDCIDDEQLDIKQLEKHYKNDHKLMKLYHFCGNIMFGLGFFFFLFIISFYGSGFKVIGQLVELQDIITLSAFAFGSCMYLCKELFDGYFIRIKNGLDALKQSKKISDD